MTVAGEISEEGWVKEQSACGVCISNSTYSLQGLICTTDPISC